MDIDAIASLLGKRSTDPEVEAVLRRHGVARRPRLEVDPYTVDGSIVNSQDWISNLSAGIEFGFQEESAFMCLDQSDLGVGPMILTEVYFYGERPGARPYPFQLPFGLSLSDSRSAVRAKMGSFERTRRSYVRDTWEHPASRVTVSYVDDGRRVDFVICMLRAETLELVETGPMNLPSAAVMTRLVGRSIDDAELLLTFRPLGLDRDALTSREHQVIDLSNTSGLRLHFHKPSPAGRMSLLNTIECVRACGVATRGWLGTLPFGIRFNDSPQTALEKVIIPPIRQQDQDLAGEAFWEFPEFSMLVKYSTMENIVLSVSLLPPQRSAGHEART